MQPNLVVSLVGTAVSEHNIVQKKTHDLGKTFCKRDISFPILQFTG
jgi:hypothetical protein